MAAAHDFYKGHSSVVTAPDPKIDFIKDGRRAVPSATVSGLPLQTHERIKDIPLPHIESFNFMLDQGLELAVKDLMPREFRLAPGTTPVRMWIDNVTIDTPRKDERTDDPMLYPSECRERKMTYGAMMRVTVAWQIGSGPVSTHMTSSGVLPIMIGSKKCHLYRKTPEELVAMNEEPSEFGGYFICNGIERIVRMLQLPRRNFPMAIQRGAFAGKGAAFTKMGVQIRSVRKDQSSVTLTLHHLSDGGVQLRFTVLKREFFVPVVLVMRALMDVTDRQVFEAIVGGSTGGIAGRTALLLQESHEHPVLSSAETRAYLGSRFKHIMDPDDLLTDAQVATVLLDRYVLVHLSPQQGRSDGADAKKFALLALMVRKLLLFAEGDVTEDNADALANQELLTPGNLCLAVIKEMLDDLLLGAEEIMKKDARIGRLVVPGAVTRLDSSASSAGSQASAATGTASIASAATSRGRSGSDGVSAARGSRQASVAGSVAAGTQVSSAQTAASRYSGKQYEVGNLQYVRMILDRQLDIGSKMYKFLATGNLASRSGLDLMQASGFTVVADKINWLRFLTHFRSVHRGQFFMEMKTTAVRKLLPESWGFMCPVHTPDGAPCGLLNHLTAAAQPVAYPCDTTEIPRLLVALGMRELRSTGGVVPHDWLPVVLDGQVLGSCREDVARRIAWSLRLIKSAVCSGSVSDEHMDAENVADAQGSLGDGCGLVGSGIPKGPAELVERRKRAIHAQRMRRSLRDAVRCLVRGAVRGMPVGSVVAQHVEADPLLPPDAAMEAADEDSPARGGSLLLTVPRELLLGVPASLEVAYQPSARRLADGAVKPAGAGAASVASAAMQSDDASSDDSDDDGGERKRGDGAGGAADEEEDLSGPFPGLFLMSEPARMVRPCTLFGGIAAAAADEFGLTDPKVPSGASGTVEACFRSLAKGRGFELLGAMEQPFLDIACTRDDFAQIAGWRPNSEGMLAPVPGSLLYSHLEISPMQMLSVAASLTPFSDMNQSPRNMYQCQMGKQTLGTAATALSKRSDTKLYRIQSPQAPLVQCNMQSELGMDQYPAGTNAIVAVIAYTGMDMEDAMIINKSSYERGFGHASVYKNKQIDLLEELKKETRPERFVFGNQPTAVPGQEEPMPAVAGLDADGFPEVGTFVRKGDPLYSYYDTASGVTKVVLYKENEPCYVEDVKLLGRPGTKPVVQSGSGGSAGRAGDAAPGAAGGDGSASGSASVAGGPSSGGASGRVSLLTGAGPRARTRGASGFQYAALRLRYNRNPIVGDKFSSRHGQKGVLSILWPQEDMPFSESGMSPDVIINPHAFPSRMTIGMLCESMAGKAGALAGQFQDSTPFRFGEQDRAVDYFGRQLRAAGYHYHGSEPLYSGTNGTELVADIYMGVVYYQRLRHMVSDKSQVRSMGPVDPVTNQPVKGRKRGGGVRFGEMERDSLVAHGASFLMRDRLMMSSDRHVGVLCRLCGSIVSPQAVLDRDYRSHAAKTMVHRRGRPKAGDNWYCKSCYTGEGCVAMELPYVFRYLAHELGGMGIRLGLEADEMK